MNEAAPAPVPEVPWARLSPWSILHFAARGVAQNVQLAYLLIPAMLGASMTGLAAFAWYVPGLMLLLVIGSAILSYRMFSYRLLESAVQIRHGVLVRKQLDLPVERIQNVNFEDPFYFRPLGLRTIRIDGAGSSSDEVYLGALTRQQAELIRNDIIIRKRRLVTGSDGSEAVGTADLDPGSPAGHQPFFSRSLADLVVHGLTNNRALLIVGGVFAFLSQTPLSLERIFRSIGMDLGAYLAAQSVTRLAGMSVIAVVGVLLLLALLSVVASIVTNFGFRMYRSRDSFTLRRGLFTRHETHVRKSRIQSVLYSQAWLDFLMGRRDVIFEQISHAAPGTAAPRTSRTVVPAVALRETAALMDGILPGVDVDRLAFTPISRRYFHKHAIIVTLLYLVGGIASLVLDVAILRLALLLWPFHLVLIHMRWKRAGLAVQGDHVVARSGAIGINYRIVPAWKVQQVRHLQSLLMKRRGLSNIRLQTAASTISVPCLDTSFAKAVIDHCLYRVESTRRSWM